MTQPQKRHSRYRQNPRESIIEVVEVDVGPFFDDLLKTAKEQDSITYENVLTIRPRCDDLCYVNTTQGIFLINHEAIAETGDEDPLTEDGNKQNLPLYRSTSDSFDMFPWKTLPIDRDFVLGLPVKGRTNFADFVKRFGDRLERNFDNWNEFLTPIFVPGETDVE